MKIGYPIFVVLVGVYLNPFQSDAYGDVDDGSYFGVVFDESHTLLLGTVQRVDTEEPTRDITYGVKMADDLRNAVRKDSVVMIHGRSILNRFGGPPTEIPKFNLGSVAILPVKRTADPSKFEYEAIFWKPLGFDFRDPIPANRAADVRAAFREMSTAISTPGHSAPSKKRVDELLKEKNYYLWAFGVWRLCKNAHRDDIDRLEKLFLDDSITPERVLWLDSMFDDGVMNGPAVADIPDAGARLGFVRRALEVYVENKRRQEP